MRYLLFNAAVAAALVYLFVVGDKSADTAKDTAAEAMARLEALAEQAASEVDRLAEPDPVPEVASEGIDASDAPEPRPVATAEKTPPADPRPRSEAVGSPPVAVLGSEPPLPVRAVETVPVHTVPLPGSAGDPGRRSPARAAAPVQVEERLMSPQERRRELFTLAEEMELLYVRKVGQ